MKRLHIRLHSCLTWFWLKWNLVPSKATTNTNLLDFRAWNAVISFQIYHQDTASPFTTHNSAHPTCKWPIYLPKEFHLESNWIARNCTIFTFFRNFRLKYSSWALVTMCMVSHIPRKDLMIPFKHPGVAEHTVGTSRWKRFNYMAVKTWANDKVHLRELTTDVAQSSCRPCCSWLHGKWGVNAHARDP